jgi:YD repeat-containing protein
VVSQSIYDTDGNVVQSFSPRAVDCGKLTACEPSRALNYVTTNHYDQLNRLIRVDLPINSTDGIASDATQYYIHRSYDVNGNLHSVSVPTTQSDPTQVSAGALTVNSYFDPGWIASSQVGTNSLIDYDYNGKGQQTCRRPSAPCTTSTPNTVLWSYQPNGKLASRSDQQGQLVKYTYDSDDNLVSSHASGITDTSQFPIDTQNSYDDLDRLARSDLKSESPSVTNWTFSSFAYDLNGNVSDQDQNGLEQNGSNGLPNGVVVKDGHKLHSDYDQANWLTDQIDSTLNQEVFNTFTPIGLESSREIDQITGPGSFNLKQKTAWSYFANGKLSTLTTTVPSQPSCQTPCTTTQTIESHTVSYLDGNGVYLDGNRTQDQFSLRPGGSASSPCFPATCTATYGYDPRDRLVSNNDGHGNQTSYTLDGAGNIQTQVVQNGTTTTTTSNTYDPNNLVQLQKSVSGSQTFLYWYDSLGRQQCVTDSGGSQANCNPSEYTPGSKDLLQDYKYDYLDRLQTYRTYSGGGSPTDEANYVYDALNRTVQETEVHPGFNGDKHITQFSYLGLGGLETEEQQTSKNTTNTLFIKDFTYDVYGHRLAMTDTPTATGWQGRRLPPPTATTSTARSASWWTPAAIPPKATATRPTARATASSPSSARATPTRPPRSTPSGTRLSGRTLPLGLWTWACAASGPTPPTS